jgi:phosphopantothenoylcysteine decarboxylase / phosphopantothenate---cysteine ligase
MLTSKRILLIIGGGIAAYKSLELIRRLREQGCTVSGILTAGGQEFITPMSVAALSEQPVYTDLFNLKDEAEMGHIQLSRQADLIVVAPATADLLAKMVAGLANDLASTVLLATDKPVLVVPAMNVRMWRHASTQRTVKQLRADGVHFAGPVEGAMACGEFGPGRMLDVPEIISSVQALLGHGPLKGKHALVTAGPTHEPIDPVRYIANRSSGKQGFAIAAALAAAGARVTLVSGPVTLPTPASVTRIDVESALQMEGACKKALPADVAVCVAAVADWRTAGSTQKIKKNKSGLPKLALTENPDILAGLCVLSKKSRPGLVIGFAAETENVLEQATAKRVRKGCDWIIANDVSQQSDIAGGVMGADSTTVHLISAAGTESWIQLPKSAVAEKLVQRIIAHVSK